MKSFLKKRGSRGCSPHVASPLGGRAGVTLIAAAENYSNDGKKGFLLKIEIFRYKGRMFIFYHCDERRRPKTGLPVRRFK
jgi:hypothetical protein